MQKCGTKIVYHPLRVRERIRLPPYAFPPRNEAWLSTRPYTKKARFIGARLQNFLPKSTMYHRTHISYITLSFFELPSGTMHIVRKCRRKNYECMLSVFLAYHVLSINKQMLLVSDSLEIEIQNFCKWCMR